MNPLDLSDREAWNLIKLLKMVLKKYHIDLKPGNKGNVLLKANQQYEFILSYFTPKNRDDKISIHLREKETNLNLIRLNIDPIGFHKNADGEKIMGNRLMIFSSEEFLHKNDGSTYVKAFNLPNEFTSTDNLEQVFLDFLLYINVKQEGKIKFPTLL